AGRGRHPGGRPPAGGREMDVFEAIERRRSIKRFSPGPVSREEIERLLDAAVRAPNHRMTEPWGFIVLGPEARRQYADLRARSKAADVADPAQAEAIAAKVREETEAVPAMIAVTCLLAEDAMQREEDY